MPLPLIAIVDDDRRSVEMLERLMRMSGYPTLSTQHSPHVPLVLAQHRPALLILDLGMEHAESGWRVVDALRADPVTQQLPIIVCSAAWDMVQRVQQRADPSTLGIAKPFQPETLLATIKRLLEETDSP